MPQANLGIQKMPDGYSLMLDDDGQYFYWERARDGATSVIHWNKWAVWRGAKLDAARASDHLDRSR
jgi:hypothetical protein